VDVRLKDEVLKVKSPGEKFTPVDERLKLRLKLVDIVLKSVDVKLASEDVRLKLALKFPNDPEGETGNAFLLTTQGGRCGPIAV
jgi:hypothetical protein